MAFVILYFSGTGNTALISKEIQNRLQAKGHAAQVVSVEDHKALAGLSFENKTIGIGYPVYKYTYPDILNQLFPLLERAGGNRGFFQFATYARFTGYALSEFSARMKKIGYHCVAGNCFKAPSCGIEARKTESGYDWESVMFFENDIALKLDAFTDQILAGRTQDMSESWTPAPVRLFIKAVVRDVEKTNYPKLQIQREKCTVCGLCAKKCPDHNLVRETGHIKILDPYECLHCLRCVNNCPANAISFGRLTDGDYRYTLDKRNRLYEKAAAGYQEEYWDNFKATVLAWRRKTLRYWLKHRKHPEV